MIDLVIKLIINSNKVEFGDYMDSSRFLKYILNNSMAMLGVIAIVGIIVWVLIIRPSMALEVKQMVFITTFLGVYGIMRYLATRSKKSESQ